VANIHAENSRIEIAGWEFYPAERAGWEFYVQLLSMKGGESSTDWQIYPVTCATNYERKQTLKSCQQQQTHGE
jgi:hypothetical protein